ncbi:MAG: hypothetical protein V5A88_06475 [Candidatus Thermoplasmatota archaeon]
MCEADVGELIVGAYLKKVVDCEIVTYHQTSLEKGEQKEIDVLGINTSDDGKEVFLCEVVTHLDGMRYKGKPSTDRWNNFGSDNYQHTLEIIWKKFMYDYEYGKEVWGDVDKSLWREYSYILQLWSPKVPEGLLTEGLDKLKREFEDEYGVEIELVINEKYKDRIEELRTQAYDDKTGQGVAGYRFFQITENI